jgi:NDP-sugar pyrophosphorylase family protein
VKAVVLVGGEGTRLRPLTISTPKQMLPIVEVPMIERVLGHLAHHGIDEAVLSIGYLPDAFLSAYPDGMVKSVRLSYAVEPEPLDTAGAVRFAADEAGIAETFVVVNGDVVTDLDLTALVAFHRERGAEGTIHLHPVSDPSAFGVVPTDDGGRVTAFIEKPPRDEAPTNLINAGTYVLEPSALERIPSGRRVSIERETFPAMVRDGQLFAMADDSYWLDAGTPSAYLQAHRDLVDGRRDGPPVPGARRADGGYWVRGTPTIAGTVTGACFIADAVEVAEGAVVDRSVLGVGCVIEPGAQLSESVLLAGARVAANSLVNGSILGPGSTVGERGDVRPISILGMGTVVSSGTVLEGERVPG